MALQSDGRVKATAFGRVRDASLKGNDPSIRFCIRVPSFLKGHHFWAEKAFRGTLLVRKALLPSEHPEVSRSLQNLAAVLQRRGSVLVGSSND